jgi:hypothetical protein
MDQKEEEMKDSLIVFPKSKISRHYGSRVICHSKSIRCACKFYSPTILKFR